MLDRQWRKQLEQHLHKRGIGSDESRRLVEELADHWEDCLLEDPSMLMPSPSDLDRRLGRPADIAATASQMLRRGPVVVAKSTAKTLFFLLGPVVLVGLILNAYVWAGMGIAYVSGIAEAAQNYQPLTGVKGGLAWFLLTAVHFVPFIIAAAVFSWFVRRFAFSSLWGLAACCVIALLAFAFVSNISLPTPVTQGQFQMGFTITKQNLALIQWVQLAAPLLAGGLILIYDRHPGVRGEEKGIAC